MRIKTTQNLTGAQKKIITELWNSEYPEQLKYNGVGEFEAFLNRNTEHRHFLLFDENENLKGWLVTFRRDGERWFSIIVDSGEQKKGYGTRLLNEVKGMESELSGWAISHDDYLKINGQKYLSPLEFYRKNGFSVMDNVRLEKPDFYAVKINWVQ
jgi:GNAT superfamily N-acetyltransferase